MMKNSHFLVWRTDLSLLLGAIVAGASLLGEGCRRQATEERTADQNAAFISPPRGTPQRETWEVFCFQGAPVGTVRTRVYRETDNGQPVVRVEGWMRIRALREGKETQQEIQYTDLERPDGQLLRFEGTEKMGSQPLTRRGRVTGNRLEMETVTAGGTQRTAIEWQPEFRGLFALEETLRAEPLQPGQKRTLRCLMAPFFKIATLELQARDWEKVTSPEGTQELLRIDVLNQFLDGKTFQQTVWADRKGETWKTQLEDTSEFFRTTKEKALASEKEPRLDILKATVIHLDQPIPNAYLTRKVRYRVHLQGGDPVKIFLPGPSQQVQRIDANTAEITVSAVRPDQPGNPDAPPDPPTADDRNPNGIVQSDDPLIVKLAREAAGPETDPWRIAVALERFVKDYIQLVDYAQVFATAAEVAKSREGDCTEHAVFLAALCRAKGIPARTAVGLVYREGRQDFAYHMWTEVFIGEKWIPLDGTLGLGGIGGAHLKLGQSNLRNSAVDTSFLPVVQVVGKLRIEVLAVEPP
jgi:transglutaminase-like putative cysteine protease